MPRSAALLAVLLAALILLLVGPAPARAESMRDVLAGEASDASANLRGPDAGGPGSIGLRGNAGPDNAASLAAMGDTFKVPITVGDNHNVPCTFKITGADTVQVGTGGDRERAINTSSVGDVVLPSTVTWKGVEYRVTAIANMAFQGCHTITSTGIRPDDSIVSVGENAYWDCVKLQKTGLADNGTVLSLGANVFKGCSALKSTGLATNTGLTVLPNQAFYQCESLEATGLESNDHITTLKDDVFTYCYALKTTGLEHNVVSEFGGRSFWKCRALKETGLAHNTKITSLPIAAFQDCINLSETGLAQNTSVIDVGLQAFAFCTGLTKTGYEGNSAIPIVAEGEFMGCSSLTSTGLESNHTVLKMNFYAFQDCVSLKTTGLESNDSITYVSSYSYQGCTSLTTTGLATNKAVTYLGYGVYTGCTSLISTGLASNRTITNLGSALFEKCPALGASEDVEGRSNAGDLVINAPESGEVINVAKQVFVGTAFKTLYLKGAPDRFTFSDDPNVPAFHGVTIEKVYVPSSWQGTERFSNGDLDVSLDAGTLVIMDPVKSCTVERRTGTSDAATMSIAADRDVTLDLSGTRYGDLGHGISATPHDGIVEIEIGPGTGLGPDADALSAKLDVPVVYPDGAVRRGYNEVSDASVICDLAAVRYTVSFDQDGGTGSMPDQPMSYGTPARLTPNDGAIARKNWIFEGWSTERSGKGKTFTDGQSVSNLTDLEGATVTLFARWRTAVSLKLEVRAASGATPLAGAGMALSTTPDSSGEIYTVYTDPEKTSPVAFWPQLTGQDGALELYGLEPGTYYLLNERAPAGYRLQAKPVRLDIDEAGRVSIDQGDRFVPKEDTISIPVAFERNLMLPATGGLPSGPVAIGGAATALVAAAYLTARRRAAR